MTQLNTTSLYTALNRTVHSTLANMCVKAFPSDMHTLPFMNSLIKTQICEIISISQGKLIFLAY